MTKVSCHVVLKVTGVLGTEWTSRYRRAESSGTAFCDERKLLFSKLSRVLLCHMIQKTFTRLESLRRVISDNTSPAHSVFGPHMSQPLFAGRVDLIGLTAFIEYTDVRIEILLDMISLISTH